MIKISSILCTNKKLYFLFFVLFVFIPNTTASSLKEEALSLKNYVNEGHIPFIVLPEKGKKVTLRIALAFIIKELKKKEPSPKNYPAILSLLEGIILTESQNRFLLPKKVIDYAKVLQFQIHTFLKIKATLENGFLNNQTPQKTALIISKVEEALLKSKNEKKEQKVLLKALPPILHFLTQKEKNQRRTFRILFKNAWHLLLPEAWENTMQVPQDIGKEIYSYTYPLPPHKKMTMQEVEAFLFDSPNDDEYASSWNFFDTCIGKFFFILMLSIIALFEKLFSLMEAYFRQWLD